ncbi:hypothetical protein G6F66_012842 [Rhizopus arrhizus]|nr:hypothetical protein G6F66_012842 [Rhizopus arrhizus]
MNENSQQVIESSTNFQEPNSRDPRDELISQLTKQVERLTTELSQAREQIARLVALQASTQENNSSQAIANTEFPPPHFMEQLLKTLTAQSLWLLGTTHPK